MEHAMRLSNNTVRTFRIERGWSQEELALAAGLSLRTIQRVEAEGLSSLSTATSIAAAFDTNLLELQEQNNKPVLPTEFLVYGTAILGLVVVTLALVSESGRLPWPEIHSRAYATINFISFVVGTLLIIPAFISARATKRLSALALVVLGTPLLTLSIGSLIFAFSSDRPWAWQLAIFGFCGLILLAMGTNIIRKTSLHDDA